MKVLVTGNRGYIGVILTPMLQAAGHEVTGIDSDLYSRCTFAPGGEMPEVPTLLKDIRDVEPSDFEGIDAVLHLAALSNDPLGDFRPEVTEDINFHGTMRVARAAKAAGVGHVVLATGLGASPKAGLTFGKWHSDTQELLKESGLDWTFVQPTYFMQNLLWQAEGIARDGVYYDDLGGPVAWIDARDIADVAAEALTAPGYEGKALGLTGPEALTGDDIAALLSEVTGRNVTCAPLSAEDTKASMIAGGMQDEVAGAMVELASIAPKGYLAGIETTVSDVLGRPARRFADFVAQNRDAFVQ